MKNNNIRKILGWVIIQISIVSLFIVGVQNAAPINPNNGKHISVIVENTQYYRTLFSMDNNFSIYSDGIEYQFPSLGIFSESSSRKLYESIEIGDKIEVVYIERYHWFQKKNLVIDAKDTTTTYLTREFYNSQKEVAFVGYIIIFIIIEMLFLFSLLINFLIFGKKKHHKKC